MSTSYALTQNRLDTLPTWTHPHVLHQQSACLFHMERILLQRFIMDAPAGYQPIWCDLIRSQWKHCTSIVHALKKSAKQMSLHKELIDEVCILHYSSPQSDLIALDRHLLDTSLDNLITWRYHSFLSWKKSFEVTVAERDNVFDLTNSVNNVTIKPHQTNFHLLKILLHSLEEYHYTSLFHNLTASRSSP